MDNGPELGGKSLDAWAYRHGVTLDFITPGKPVENAFAESFNGKFRDESLSQHWFLSLPDARFHVSATGAMTTRCARTARSTTARPPRSPASTARP